jgi:hypothetical protein
MAKKMQAHMMQMQTMGMNDLNFVDDYSLAQDSLRLHKKGKKFV